VIGRYYKNKKLLQADCLLFLLYFFSNPYRMCRKFLEKKRAHNIYAYGETPLTTLEQLVLSFNIQPEDRWLDLGAGRGRGCFWISEVWGCPTRGIEWIPSFVSRAAWIVKQLSLPRLEFQNIVMEKADFSWPDVVYLCGTCMSEEEIEALLIPMKALRSGAKVITISEPLNDPSYLLIQSIPVSFPWGETEAFLQIKN
jgi:hypothetical protein